jgi:membrane fusion protein, multidrug efflux system
MNERPLPCVEPPVIPSLSCPARSMREALPGRSALASLLLLGVLAACSSDATPEGAPPAAGGAPGAMGRGGGGGRGPAVTPIEIEVAQATPVARSSAVSGVLEPLRTVSVSAIVGGTVDRVRVEEGSRVRRGAVLAELDARELSAQLRSAEASLALARTVAQRSAALREKRVVTEVEFERDQTAAIAAEASVDQLRTRLSFTQVKAPIDGVIVTQAVQAGDVVSGQATLFTIAEVATLVTRFAVSELDVLRLTPGLPVTVTVDAMGGAAIEGRVRRIFPAADPATRLIPVEVALSGPQTAQLRPGFTVRARLALEAPRDVLTVPSRALAGAAAARYLFVVRGDKVERRTVRAGEDRDGRTEIFEGVVAGDSIVTAGNALLRDGGAVRIVTPIVSDTGTRRSP